MLPSRVCQSINGLKNGCASLLFYNIKLFFLHNLYVWNILKWQHSYLLESFIYLQFISKMLPKGSYLLLCILFVLHLFTAVNKVLWFMPHEQSTAAVCVVLSCMLKSPYEWPWDDQVTRKYWHISEGDKFLRIICSSTILFWYHLAHIFFNSIINSTTESYQSEELVQIIHTPSLYIIFHIHAQGPC